MEAGGEAGALDDEDVLLVDAGRTVNLLDALHDDVCRVRQHGERDGDLHGDQHGTGAIAQQCRQDGADVEHHGRLLTDSSGTPRGADGRCATPGTGPAASVAAIASNAAHTTPTTSKCMSSW